MCSPSDSFFTQHILRKNKTFLTCLVKKWEMSQNWAGACFGKLSLPYCPFCTCDFQANDMMSNVKPLYSSENINFSPNRTGASPGKFCTVSGTARMVPAEA